MHENSFLPRLCVAIWVICVSGCSFASSDSNEVVMCPGSRIDTEVGGQAVSIIALNTLRREFVAKGAGVDVTVEMWPRRERWDGSLGLYVPTGFGSIHVVAEEGLQHFDSMTEVQTWLAWNRQLMPLSYTSNGLVVGWKYRTRPAGISSGPPAALSVEVWQILIRGSKPDELAGAEDKLFKVSMPLATCTHPAPYTASPPTVIDGRKVAGRVVDFLKERGVPLARLEQVLREGTKESDGDLTIYRTPPGHDQDIGWIAVERDGSVVLAGL